MRAQFDQQLERLHVELITMGALCEDAISAAAKALLDNDNSLLPKVADAERQIDRKEREIETLCLRLILQQQPVARDLRTISSALKMLSDMERIGDQASDIADICKQISPGGAVMLLHIKEMALSTVKMVTDSVESFVKENLSLAKSVISYDDVVDGLFAQIKEALVELIGKDPHNAPLCLDLLMVAKYFERIGDHAVNIAEWVEFSMTGKHVGDAV